MEVDDLPEGYLQGFAFAKEVLVYGCNFNPSSTALSQRLERFIFLLLFKIHLHLLVLNKDSFSSGASTLAKFLCFIKSN